MQETDGTWQTVLGSEREEHPDGITVYNLEVEGDHTYFVEDGGAADAVWVHNLYTPCGPMVGRRVGHTFKMHGEGEDVAAFLRRRAKGSGQPQGQWTDNTAAEQFIASHLKDLANGARDFPLPAGLGRIIHPDGTITNASFARLVPSGNGVKTAYPI